MLTGDLDSSLANLASNLDFGNGAKKWVLSLKSMWSSNNMMRLWSTILWLRKKDLIAHISQEYNAEWCTRSSNDSGEWNNNSSCNLLNLTFDYVLTDLLFWPWLLMVCWLIHYSDLDSWWCVDWFIIQGFGAFPGQQAQPQMVSRSSNSCENESFSNLLHLDNLSCMRWISSNDACHHAAQTSQHQL